MPCLGPVMCMIFEQERSRKGSRGAAGESLIIIYTMQAEGGVFCWIRGNFVGSGLAFTPAQVLRQVLHAFHYGTGG